MDAYQETMVLLYRDAYKTIEELSQEELRLGGLRIDPKTNIGSRITYYNAIKIKDISSSDSEIKEVSGLPSKPRLANFSWSPDQKKMALTNTTMEGVELWMIDIQEAKATRLTEARINANMRDVINWFEDSQALLVKMLSGEKQALIDTKTAVPGGPTISVSDGKKRRTEPTRIF